MREGTTGFRSLWGSMPVECGPDLLQICIELQPFLEGKQARCIWPFRSHHFITGETEAQASSYVIWPRSFELVAVYYFVNSTGKHEPAPQSSKKELMSHISVSFRVNVLAHATGGNDTQPDMLLFLPWLPGNSRMKFKAVSGGMCLLIIS